MLGEWKYVRARAGMRVKHDPGAGTPLHAHWNGALACRARSPLTDSVGDGLRSLSFIKMKKIKYILRDSKH
jgi:hypothetical protein